MSKSLLSFGGIPTLGDVTKLIDKIGIPEEGVLIPYEVIEKIIQQDKSSFRFNSVTTAWRKKLQRENNIVMRTESGKGYVRASGKERVDISTRKYKGGLRGIVRAGKMASTIDRKELNATEKMVADHLTVTAAKLIDAAHIAARENRIPDVQVKRLTA